MEAKFSLNLLLPLLSLLARFSHGCDDVSRGCGVVHQVDGPLVVTAGGTVLGSYKTSYSGERFASFQGIPFAKPPVGELRYRAPQDPEDWGTDILDLSADSTVKCIQNSVYDLNDDEEQGIDAESTEDCLYINLYRHEDGSSSGKPVIVYFHGGSLFWGSARYDDFGPELFMDHDIILVQVNYRLGPFGFLSLGTEDVPGNQGFRDQSKALRWVQDNIASFGGDPAKVTIMGESAGSWSVYYHLFSPLSAGTFSKAVLLSGVMDFARAFRSMTAEEGVAAGMQMSANFGCAQSDLDARSACLRSTPVKDIFAQRYSLDQPNDVIPTPPTPYIGYSGIMDAEYMEGSAEGVFLPDDPRTLLENGDFNSDISVIIGNVKDEGLVVGEIFILVPQLLAPIAADWDYYGPYVMVGELSGQASPAQIEFATEAIDFYVGGAQNVDLVHLPGLVDLITDAEFLYGTHRLTEALSEAITGEVFQYLYTYNGDNHWFDLDGIEDASQYGVNHADDLYSVFRPFLAYREEGLQLGAADEAVALRHVGMFASFAASGGEAAMRSDFGWAPVTPVDHRYLRIDEEVTMEASEYYRARMALWEAFEPIDSL